jgi:PhnB protein
MAKINPYLNFNGNTEEAFNFYKSVFGGTFTTFMRFKDMPEGVPGQPAQGDKVMHVALPISGDSILMGSDTPDSFPPVNTGTNFSISINADSEKEADKIFSGLSAGGKVKMPLAKTFWGAYFGMLDDKFGIQWMVNFDYNRK